MAENCYKKNIVVFHLKVMVNVSYYTNLFIVKIEPRVVTA